MVFCEGFFSAERLGYWLGLRVGIFSVCDFGAHGGEFPETRAPGLFGLRSDAQPRSVSHLSAPTPAQLCRRWRPSFTNSVRRRSGLGA